MPLINRCGGGVSVVDLCAQVEGFAIIPSGSNSLTVVWSAPKDDSFVGARIVRKTGSAPTGINDGTVVYEGTELNYTDTGLTAGTTYYYRAFAYNAKKRYQTAPCTAYATTTELNRLIFANNDWQYISTACKQRHPVIRFWNAGDSKEMTIDGKSLSVDIVGKNHDVFSNLEKAALSFQLHDCLSRKTAHAVASDDQSYDSYLNLLPEEIQSSILTVVKRTNGKDIPMRLFPLSYTELFGGTFGTYNPQIEGEQYEYYKAGNSKIKYAQVQHQGRQAVDWWLRTNYKPNVSNFGYIDASGQPSAAYYDGSKYVNFGFCF